MRSSPSRRRLAVCGAVAVALAACGDNPAAPKTITNPAATIADLFAADSVFDSDAYRALQSLGSGIFPIPAPPALARLVATLRVTLPPAPGHATRVLLDRQLARRDARLPAGLLGASSRVPVLPDTLLGVTFVWEPDSLRYVASNRAGAPANGVRFVLYAPDALALPDTAAEVGTLDIVDVAPAAGAQLRFLVRGVPGAPTFLDYTLTFLPAASAFSVQAAGYVSNGAPGVRERRFTFSASITHADLAEGPSGTVDFTYDVNVPDVGVELHLASSDDTLADTSLSAIDYRLTRRTENIRFVGADTSTSGGTSDHGQFVATVNNYLYATLTLTNGNAVITDATGAVVPMDDTDQRYEDVVMLFLVFGVIYAGGILAEVLAIPAILLGFTIGLL